MIPRCVDLTPSFRASRSCRLAACAPSEQVVFLIFGSTFLKIALGFSANCGTIRLSKAKMSLVQTIRDYRPVKMLGQGGFGVTYLVTDEAPHRNRRQCVLKQFKPAQRLDLETLKEMQRRFSIEAKALQTLGQRCDRIPKLYDEFSENGEFYLVQEYIEGKTLAQKVKETGAFPEAGVRKLLIRLLSVIHQVHANRMIHRDITPDNIMLRSKDAKPVLIDFGAVKEVLYTIVDSKGAPLDISIVIGKKHYMPNEQKLGTPRYESDLYSLGLCAIYLLTGKSPQEFTRDRETMSVQWHSHAPRVSAQLKSILDKAIQVDYRDRYATAQEMLRDLEKSVAGDTTVTFTRPLTKEEAAKKRAEWERNCREVERREREAKEAVRLYVEKLEREFQEDLKRRQAEDAKYKAEIRRKRELQQQTGKEAAFDSDEIENRQNELSRSAIGFVILFVVIGIVTKLLGLW